MSLKKYKQKRDFRQSPEPKGKKEKKKENRFVIQKHAATNLHYDFRLEMDGVLKSWAIPKKPPQKAGIKRLAMQVEDHPIDYINFAGEIPQGNYGAGQVEIWDKGRYKMEEKKKNEFKFILKGNKLKGEYVLVKPKGSSFGKKAWLFFKTKSKN
ncbi:MAG: DNA polymerase ligase N-terminal domain-containing protein [Patescibacteria group bacterium]|nr:DNA polymerase ligase N-terminal domain-containing protein [Patescibacteria group bacterium]